LPEEGIVKATSVTFPVGDASLSMSGGQVDVTGGTVSKLSWAISPTKTIAFVTIQADRIKSITDAYIVEEIEKLREALHLFVLGGIGNGNISKATADEEANSEGGSKKAGGIVRSRSQPK